MEKKQNVPALRFQGFSGEWEKKRLKDIGTIMTGNTPSPSHSEYYSDDGIFWVTPSDIMDVIVTNTARKLSPEGEKVSHIAEAGSILVTCIASIGKNTLLLANGGFNQQINSLTPDKNYDSFFLLYESFLWSEKMKQEAATGTMQIINKKEFSEILASVPSYEEQTQIGQLLKRVETISAFQSRKVRKLQQFRQAMLAKLFPREGAAEPELRFRGFSGKWKSQKMKDLGSFLKGKLYSKKNIQTSGVPLILYGRLYTQYELVIDEVDTFAVPYENSVWSIGGEVIVPASGETAEDIAIASVVKRKGILLGGDLNIIRPNDTVSSVFLALSISYGHIHNELAKRAQGKSIVHIHNSDLVQLDIRLPSIEEQKAIGDFFYQLDRYISLQQKKLKRMQRLKAALLEKLFV